MSSRYDVIGPTTLEAMRRDAELSRLKDRIEALEVALRKAENGLSVALMWSDDDGTWVAHEIVLKARDIARTALAGEEKDD